MAKKEPPKAGVDLPPGEPKAYDHYLQNILSEFGLKLESDGSHITEMEVSPLSFEELKDTEEEEAANISISTAGGGKKLSEDKDSSDDEGNNNHLQIRLLGLQRCNPESMINLLSYISRYNFFLYC